MSDDLRTRIAAVLARFLCEDQCGMDFDNGLPCPTCVERSLPEADAVIRELGAIPDRIHVDDQRRTWEWCGGKPGTWAWRITRLDRLMSDRSGNDGVPLAAERGNNRNNDLRTRIAAVLSYALPDVQCERFLAAADAVIRELGLRREDRDGSIVRDWLGQPIRINEPKCRYVTDWETDQ